MKTNEENFDDEFARRIIAMRDRLGAMFEDDLSEAGRVMTTIRKALGFKNLPQHSTPDETEKVHDILGEVMYEVVVDAVNNNRDFPTAEHAANAMIAAVFKKQLSKGEGNGLQR
jgi:hypothetical protein